MALSTQQQILEIIERSKSILLTFRKNWSVDALTSALAVSQVLTRMEKSNTIAASGFEAPAHLAFLPGIDRVRPSLEAMRKFIITLALRNAEVEEFTYDIVDGKLVISIIPRKGFFAPHDVTTGSSDWRYDLVMVFDTPDLESLGGLYTESPEFFYRTPTVNIDHTTHNEHYGKINLIDVTAAATAEVVANLFTSWDMKLVDDAVATNLLTGITAETESFRLPTVTPQTLSLASQLVSMGAKREEIVSNLYRTKTVASLKLWGRALARLKQDTLAQCVWSVLPATDFERAGGTVDDLVGVMDELMVSIPKTRIALLIAETAANALVHVFARTHDRHLDLHQTLSRFQPAGDRAAVSFVIKDKPAVAVEREVVDEVRGKLLAVRT
ncbi:MAG: hypothetical protein WC659_04705 [Patescibacteria group bacterium]